jgi:hypothetical protein
LRSIQCFDLCGLSMQPCWIGWLRRSIEGEPSTLSLLVIESILEGDTVADIFLSYSTEDAETTEQLAHAFEQEGWSVFWDRKIPPGQRWEDVLERELEAAKCVVVLWSKAAVESEWVWEEASEAKDMGKLVPVLIEDVKPPLGFRSIEAAKLTHEGFGPEFEGLVSAVGSKAGVAIRASRSKRERKREDAEMEDSDAGAAGQTKLLGRGASGSTVYDLQERLAELGFNPGEVDGIFGPDTTKAVRDFQKTKRLAADGICGPETWAALGWELLQSDAHPRDNEEGD